jgi:hypothetical protein
MSEENRVPQNSVGFAGWLGLLFIGLKLTGYIDWPWVWVLAPLWAGLALVTVFMTVAVVIIGFLAFVGWAFKKDEDHG